MTNRTLFREAAKTLISPNNRKISLWQYYFDS